MKLSAITFSFVVATATAQDVTNADSYPAPSSTVNGPVEYQAYPHAHPSNIGGECAALGPSYYSACCATRTADPSCPTGTVEFNHGLYGQGIDCVTFLETKAYHQFSGSPPPPGSSCASVGPQFHAECCKRKVPGSDPSCGPDWTTSVITTTVVSTISDCPSSVTDCPYRTSPGTTTTVVELTTICPVAAASTTPYTWAPPVENLITSVYYVTVEQTITSCPPDVTNCPARVTSTVSPYTTICPESTIAPPYTQIAAGSSAESYAPSVTQVAASSAAGSVVPCHSCENEAPLVSPIVPPPVSVASNSSGEISTQTSGGVVEYTGAADFKRAGTWGIAAGLGGFVAAML